MKIKYISLFIIALAMSLIIMGCAEIENLPRVVELENYIREFIISKGDDYDFINDELYISKMEELVDIFVENDAIKKEHFALGNLDDDNIPELVIFRERNPEDKDDEGKLDVYKFNGEIYGLLDNVSMNYDNTNYEIVIGEIAKGQRGVYINNHVGAHSSITYGFILREDKLISILNEKRLNLISPYAANEIKDIDNDGILEFSVPIVDPEVEDPYAPDMDKIILWYKWDGKDGGILTKVERKKGANSNDKRISNKDILSQAKYYLKSENYVDFLNYISENKDSLSLEDNSELLKRYLSNQNNNKINYQNLIDTFGNDLLREYRDYLKILALNSTEPYLVNGKLMISQTKLAERIVLLENYKMTYPYSNYFYRVDKIYRDYIRVFILGSENNLTINSNTYEVPDNILENFKSIKEKYPHTYFSDILSNLLNDLSINGNKFNKDIISKYNKLLM